MDKKYKIYVLRDPIDNTIRYVGYTGNSLETRLKGHINEAKYKTHTHKLNWIRKLLADKQIPIIELIEDCIHIDNIDEREIFYIKYFSHLNLTNSTGGGDGGKSLSLETKEKISKSLTGKKHSLETKEKMSVSALNKPFKHRKTHIVSDEAKQKMSITMSGKKHTEATKKKISIANTGKNHTDEAKTKISEFQKSYDHSYKLGNSNAHGSVRSDEHKETIRQSHLDTKWIYNDNADHKKIKKTEVDKWLALGWKLGRKVKPKIKK